MLKSWIAKHWCLHDWKQIKEIDVVDYTLFYRDKDGKEISIYRKYLYVCKKCGEFKEIKF
jgi:hypothetical protein